jgi:2-dehydropantoate 2-reductase
MKKEQKYRFGIIGLGPVGMTLSVFLKEAGQEVILYDIDRLKINRIRQDGIRLENVITKHAGFDNICTSIDELKEQEPDFLVICLKAYQAELVVPLLEKFVSDDICVISAQNGIDTENIYVPLFGERRVLRMVINFAGNQTGPNVIKTTFFNPPNYIASIDDSLTHKSELIAGLLSSVGLDTLHINSFELIKRSWEKTILNSSLSALCGVGRLTIREAMEMPDTLEIIEQIIEEAVEVAAAEKINFEDDFVRKCLRYLKKAGNHFPSLAVDLINNRQTEIDYLNGKILEYGRKHYIRTSLNLSFTNMVKAMTLKNIKTQVKAISQNGSAGKKYKAGGKHFLGVDLGSSYTKFTIIDEHENVVYNTSLKTFNRDKISMRHVMDALLNEFNILSSCATGYGRKSFASADIIKTEINCAATGVSKYKRGVKNIIDIGGEDIKIIHCDVNDNVENFYLNDKCAAGTGSFIVEVAERAGLSISEMNDLASKSQFENELNSFCTVFAKTEIMKWIFEGIPVEDIAKGIYLSIVNRVAKLRINNSLPVYIVGGVIAHHHYLTTLLEKRIGQKVEVVPDPQFVVSLGAALFAKGNIKKTENKIAVTEAAR